GPGADDLRNHRHSSAPRPRRTIAGAGGSDRGALAAAAGRADPGRERIPQAPRLVLVGAAGDGGDALPHRREAQRRDQRDPSIQGRASRLCAVGRGSENRLAAGFCGLHRRRGTALDGDCERDRHQGRLRAAGSLEKIMLGKRIVCSAILMLACGLAAAGETTSYPARPIKMIVPFPPGGPVDVTARILTQHLPQTLGQPAVVENRAGAAGSLGAKAVASADPDGCYAETSLRSSCCLRSATIATTTRAKPSSPSRRFRKIMRCWSSTPHFQRSRCRRSSPTPRPTQASSITDRPATAMPPTSRPNCSSCEPASTSSTFPIRAFLLSRSVHACP